VYKDRWLSKEDWRGVASFIKTSACPGTEYWAFLNAHYSFGYGYYEPSLIRRSHLLYKLPDGAYASSVVDAVLRQRLGVRDWVIVQPDWPTSVGTDTILRGLGWSATEFPGIVVYHHGICPGGPGSR